MKKLYFKYGAMNSGKTLEILRTAYNFEENGFHVIVVKPGVDLKGQKNIVSRIGAQRKVDCLLEPNEMLSSKIDLTNVAAIIVDEAQFLNEDQVNDLWIITKFNDINVFCYGLKTDFQSKCFPGSKRLLEVADKIEEITTLCKCGNKAMFNLRKNNGIPVFDGNQIAIDGIDATYEPVCGLCYLKEKGNIRVRK